MEAHSKVLLTRYEITSHRYEGSVRHTAPLLSDLVGPPRTVVWQVPLLPVYVPCSQELHFAKVFKTLFLWCSLHWTFWLFTLILNKLPQKRVEDSIQKLVTVLQTRSITLQGNSLIFKAVPQKIKYLQTLSDTGQLRETTVYYHAWIFLIKSQLPNICCSVTLGVLLAHLLLLHVFLQV